MNRKTVLTISVLSLCLSSAGTALAADKTSKYRVYQNQQVLLETPDYRAAEAYARSFAHSHVEEIGTRRWIWDNYPRFIVYQNGSTQPEWEFASREQAVAEASKWSNASVRDTQTGAWIWNNYPKYRLYQGEITLSSWAFATLAEAQTEGARWSNAHIIDERDHRWVWDNLTPARKAELRAGSNPGLYRVMQGTYTAPGWSFAYLEDAVNESLKWGNSTILNTETGQTVFSNEKRYVVSQLNQELQSFLSLDEAMAYAAQYDHTTITDSGDGRPGSMPRTLWNNYPYYQVYQNSQRIADFASIPAAVSYALGYSNTTIRTFDDALPLWDNLRKLQYWGWNGSSSDATIRSHVNNTSGLDVVSPTYFQLEDASGALTDSSNQETVTWLKSQGYQVHPLVANQFDSKLTTSFLANPAARAKFISLLVNRAAELGVEGLNIDFESVAGSDRAGFTTFMRELTEAAHARQLVISVDLPRGSASWNAKTAFDHEQLAGIVDYIMTMTYDQHWKGSTEPGSVAGLQWVEQGIQEFLAYGIPRDKLILGIPFYVREWKIDSAGKLVSNRALLMKDLPALIESKKAVLTWDAKFQQYKAEYNADGFKYVFWLEDEASVKARIELAKKYDLGGVAAWRLGYDPSSLWSMMLQQK